MPEFLLDRQVQVDRLGQLHRQGQLQRLSSLIVWQLLHQILSSLSRQRMRHVQLRRLSNLSMWLHRLNNKSV